MINDFDFQYVKRFNTSDRNILFKPCKMQNNKPTPETYEQLINLVTEMFPAMNRGSQRITRYIVQNPNSMAVESVKVIAGNANVQPSSLVRFAKQIGYSGFSEMKKIFQTHLITAASSRERLDSLSFEVASDSSKPPSSFLQTLVQNDIEALQGLLETISQEDLDETVSLLLNARNIHVIGQLRSFPVANSVIPSTTCGRK